MFEGLYFEMKDKGVPVSLNEWMTLQQALDSDLARSSLTVFYTVARSILVKNEAYYDRYDRAFQSFFQGIETPDAMIQEILEEMGKMDFSEIDIHVIPGMMELTLEQVMKNFQDQYDQGHFKGHRGGNQAIGAGGTSTQGAFGYNPAGVRIGQGSSRHGRAVKIAEMRRYRNYDPDLVLDTRQIQAALSRLRTLLSTGPKDELDLDGTIDETCRNAGELELIWKAPRKNTVKLLLLMDTGGSMTPFAHTVSLLFSAAKSMFKDLKHYYFHNCIYQDLWKNIEQDESVPTEDVLRTLDSDYKVVIVGDATMAPSELLDKNGTISWFDHNDRAGIWWLHKIERKFPASVWITPEVHSHWSHSVTSRIIERVFPMHHLTLDGLDSAIRSLLTTQRPRIAAHEIQQIIDGRYLPYANNY